MKKQPLCAFSLRDIFRPLLQRNRRNDGSHLAVKTIISLTAGNIFCDGAAVVKSPETLGLFHFHRAEHHTEIKKNPEMKQTE